MNSATAAAGSGSAAPGGPAGIAALHAVLAGAGLELTAGELADALWLALRYAPEEEPEQEAPPEAAPARPPELPTLEGELAAPAPLPAPQPPLPPPPLRRPVYALTGPRAGASAAAVRVPAVPGLPNPLSVTRALRPLKRRVSSLHRYELDETATAEATADSGGLEVVLRPERARWLDLVLAVDEGLSMRVWQDTLTELRRVLATSGIFRTVRRCAFDEEDAMDAAVVDGNRTVVLAVTDGVGAGWREGPARRRLARWARKAPTAVLQPLPLRLWQGTALPAERMRVRSSRPVPANHQLDAYDPWLPARLAASVELPVPVLELGDWSLAPWAALMASPGGAATLRVIDAAAEPAFTAPAADAASRSAEERLLAFQETVGPEAYELAGHLAAVDPLTLPVMRVVQSAALPGSSPSCLSEVLLSGLMRVEQPLAGFDVFAFDPEVRSLLRMVILGSEARRTVDAVSEFIAPRLGRVHDFPALIAARSGTLELPSQGAPFAEIPAGERDPVPGAEPEPEPESQRALEEREFGAGLPAHPAVEYVVGVHSFHDGGETRLIGRAHSGYLVADGLVLTAGTAAIGDTYRVWAHPAFGEGERLDAEVVWSGDGALLLRITDPRWPAPPLPTVGYGTHPASVRQATVGTMSADVAWNSPYAARLETTTVDYEGTGWPIAAEGRLRLGSMGAGSQVGGAAVFEGPTLIGITVAEEFLDNSPNPPVHVLPLAGIAAEESLAELVGWPRAVLDERLRRLLGPPPELHPWEEQTLTRLARRLDGSRQPAVLSGEGDAAERIARAYAHRYKDRYVWVAWTVADSPDGLTPIDPFLEWPGAVTYEDALIVIVGRHVRPDASDLRMILDQALSQVLIAAPEPGLSWPSDVLVFPTDLDRPGEGAHGSAARRIPEETGETQGFGAAISEAIRERRSEARALDDRGLALAGERDFAAAATAHAQAAEIFVEIGDHRGEAKAQTNRGLALAEVWRLEEAAEAHGAAVRAYEAIEDTRGRGRALDNLGIVLRQVWRFEEAITAHVEAVDVFRVLGAEVEEARALDGLGLDLRQMGRTDEGVAAHTRAAEIFRAAGDSHGEGWAKNGLGLALTEARRFEEAVAVHTEAAEIFREAGDRRGEAWAMDYLGLDLRQHGEVSESIAAHRQAVDAFREVGDRRSEGLALVNLGLALGEAGLSVDAVEVYAVAGEIFQEVGDHHSEGVALGNRGVDLRWLGRLEEASAAHVEAARIFHESGDPRGEGWALDHLGLDRRQQRRFAVAADAHTRAAELFGEAGDRQSEGAALGNLGLALSDNRDYEGAVKAHTWAATAFRDSVDRHGEGRALDDCGLALVEARRYPEAVIAHTQAARIFAEIEDVRNEGISQRNLGLALVKAGRVQEANAAFTVAIALFDRIGDAELLRLTRRDRTAAIPVRWDPPPPFEGPAD